MNKRVLLMPYMELRDYTNKPQITEEQRDKLMEITRDHLARGQEIDGTFEFRYMPKATELDYYEYDYLYVIDMGWSEDRDARKAKLAQQIGAEIAPVLGSENIAVRLRLQNAAFVPYE